MYIILTAMKFYFITKSLFSIRFFKTLALHQHRALAIWIVDIVCGFLQYWHVKCNLQFTYAYSACLLTAQICSLISLYIVNQQEHLKKIITTNIFSRNHQLRRRLPPSFRLIRRRFVRRNFIGHHGWNGRESTNQLRQHISHIITLYFLFHQLPYTISPGYYPVLVVLNSSPVSFPPETAFLCFSRPPGCTKDHEATNSFRNHYDNFSDYSIIKVNLEFKYLLGIKDVNQYSFTHLSLVHRALCGAMCALAIAIVLY